MRRGGAHKYKYPKNKGREFDGRSSIEILYSMGSHKTSWLYNDLLGWWKPEGCFTNPTEFQIVADLLRNEKPVWWDEPTGRLYAANEPVGERE